MIDYIDIDVAVYWRGRPFTSIDGVRNGIRKAAAIYAYAYSVLSMTSEADNIAVEVGRALGCGGISSAAGLLTSCSEARSYAERLAGDASPPKIKKAVYVEADGNLLHFDIPRDLGMEDGKIGIYLRYQVASYDVMLYIATSGYTLTATGPNKTTLYIPLRSTLKPITAESIEKIDDELNEGIYAIVIGGLRSLYAEAAKKLDVVKKLKVIAGLAGP